MMVTYTQRDFRVLAAAVKQFEILYKNINNTNSVDLDDLLKWLKVIRDRSHLMSRYVTVRQVIGNVFTNEVCGAVSGIVDKICHQASSDIIDPDLFNKWVEIENQVCELNTESANIIEVSELEGIPEITLDQFTDEKWEIVK